jgi:1-aminocyclopropane-1-carboxylate synthase
LVFGFADQLYSHALGVFVSQYNHEIQRAFFALGYFSKVSSVAVRFFLQHMLCMRVLTYMKDLLWSSLLNDEETLDAFIRTNQTRLGEAFVTCRDFFKKHRIPYLGQPTAALFFWSAHACINAESTIDRARVVDLGRFHRKEDDQGKLFLSDDEKDDDLRDALTNGKVFLNPGMLNVTGVRRLLIRAVGHVYHGKPGWFRVTFAIRPDLLAIGLQRFETVIQRWEHGLRE